MRTYLDAPRLIEFLAGQESLNELPFVECPKNITQKEFLFEFVRSYRACIFKNYISDWPAMEKWPSMDYLKEKAGD